MKIGSVQTDDELPSENEVIKEKAIFIFIPAHSFIHSLS